MTTDTHQSPEGGEDSVAALAADLRRLRVAADSPTLSRLQSETGLSRSIISDAFAGRSLPSLRTLDRLVRACGGDADEWLDRREALARASRGDDSLTMAEGSADGEPGSQTRPPVVRRRTAIWLAAGALVVGVAVGAGVATPVVSSSYQAELAVVPTPENPHAQIDVRTGIDPAMSPCVNDAKVAAAENRTNNTKLEIIWSNKCYAGWGRVTRYDGLAENNTVKISIYPETAPQGPDRQIAVEPGVQSAYTTLIVRPTPETRLCAVGSITVNGNSIDLGDPICI